MKGEIWSLKLYYNICDILFNRYITLDELCVPELRHSFNITDKIINVLPINNDRYKSSNFCCKRIVPERKKILDIEERDVIILKKLINDNYKSK